MNRSGTLTGLAAALLATTLCAAATACGLEGGMGDSLAAAHEGSLAVAFAAHDAISSGWLSPDTALDTQAAHERADERLRAFVAALPAAPRSMRAFAVLQVEAGVWTRVSARAGRWSLATHVDGLHTDTTVLASGAALRDMVSGQLSADRALSMGLLAVHGDTAARDRLLGLLRQAYPDAKATTALR
ncbi:hypothetical protein GCM10025771_35080 [Niveibacterium umoris]|uniref:SCP2 domain-containing protein n=1 Tax=Niveibacterium umoris TaxID=1193620 RepID=A0A840BI37_9RHOO|nr:hypothetical protein [Niveibacterium umoris]MBB4011298.1 hypothetical protein [Niveibacterium umoris]